MDLSGSYTKSRGCTLAHEVLILVKLPMKMMIIMMMMTGEVVVVRFTIRTRTHIELTRQTDPDLLRAQVGMIAPRESTVRLDTVTSTALLQVLKNAHSVTTQCFKPKEKGTAH